MIKRMIIMLLVLAVIFGGIFGWKYYRMAQLSAMHHGQPPATVAAVKAKQENWQSRLFAVGDIVADQGLNVSNEIAGQIKEIHFQSGQDVKKGDLLIQLDDSVDRGQLQGQLAKKRLAQLEFNRLSDLLKKHTASQSSFDEARAKLHNVEAQIESTRALLHKKRIIAPFSGKLGVRRVNLGEYLTAGAPVVTLQALDQLHVDYSLAERYYAKVALGDTVKVKVQAFPGETFTGQVTAINPKIDVHTRTFQVRTTLHNPQQRLRPGMFAEVTTLLPEQRDVITVPRTAISYNPYGDFVFMINKDKDGGLSVQRRQIETGEVRHTRVEIKRSLKAGERVVAAGQVKLHNGQSVQIDNSVSLRSQAFTP